jgi:hypothetical protein
MMMGPASYMTRIAAAAACHESTASQQARYMPRVLQAASKVFIEYQHKQMQ